MFRNSRWALVALGLAWSAPVLAQSETGGTPGEWLSSYRSARTLGLGGAYVAGADDPLGVLWNPAGLSIMDQNELRFEHGILFEDASVSGLGFAVPGSRLPSLGIAIVSMRSGEVQRTNDMNDDLGTFRETETAYMFTASSLGDRFVDSPRRRLFECLMTNPNRRHQGQRLFHSHQWTDKREISVLMEREDAATVSRTVVDVTARAVALEYESLIPSRPAQRVELQPC